MELFAAGGKAIAPVWFTHSGQCLTWTGSAADDFDAAASALASLAAAAMPSTLQICMTGSPVDPGNANAIDGASAANSIAMQAIQAATWRVTVFIPIVKLYTRSGRAAKDFAAGDRLPYFESWLAFTEEAD